MAEFITPSLSGPALVIPLHDRDGRASAHLSAITPALKTLFSTAWVGLTPSTRGAVPDWAATMDGDSFFRVCTSPEGPVGVQFRALYQAAAQGSPPSQMLHLCFPDRLAYAVTAYREAFAADVATVSGPTPVLFQRTQAAWASHPRHYREIEGMITRVGQLLFGQALDFAWCHLALPAADLAGLLPATRADDMSVLAEILLAIRRRVTPRDVDWLAWEDPFYLDRPAEALMAERERGTEDVRKRLSYAIPMLARLYEEALRSGSIASVP